MVLVLLSAKHVYRSWIA